WLSTSSFFFFQAEDGIRDFHVTGVQTCALPILNALGLDAGDADGRYGPRTEAAVRKLQRLFGLPEDGRAWADVYYVLGLKGPARSEERRVGQDRRCGGAGGR